MQVIAFSSVRPGPDGELQQFERLAGTLSSRFARLHVEEIGPAIVGALEEVGRALDVEACALIELNEGATSALHSWPTGEAAFGPTRCPPRWLLDRLVKRDVVQVPAGGREPAVETDAALPPEQGGLGVPVVVGEQVVCAFVIGPAERCAAGRTRWSSGSG